MRNTEVSGWKKKGEVLLELSTADVQELDKVG